ncbi:MAG: O-antigen ligase family protein [Candidatus Pacebacteria bacterium]|nr:O-antigen ligase family protein [Candidatus Paceibacterota bacterium]
MKINLKTIIFYLIIASLFSPFFVNIQTYFPFIIGKATVFRIIIGLMIILWTLWMLGERNSDLEKKRTFFNLLAKAVIVFGVIIFISALFGANFNYSFFSNNERMEGVLGIWYFIAFFSIIVTTFNYLEIEKILKIQSGIGVFYSILAIFAYSGIGRITAQLTGERLAGYTGNPSFFAVYLLFNSFLALYFYFKGFELLRLKQNNFSNKISSFAAFFPCNDSIIWFLIFLGQSLLLFATLTRGAMVGYLISIIFIALSIIFLSKDNNLLSLKRFSILFLILILGTSIFAFVGKNTDFVKNNSILSRFASISLTDPTAKSRIFSAGTAWQSFLQKPLFGWGQENYEAAYVTNFNPEVMKYLPEDFYFDRAHNKPMEVLATNGIFGFLSYLSLFCIAFYFLNYLRRKKEWFLPSLALGGCLIGYFVQNVFLFDFHESYLMFFLVLAFIASLVEIKLPHSSKTCLMVKDKKGYASKIGKTLIIIVIICLVTFSTIQWVIKPYLVSNGIFRVGHFMKQGQGEDSFQELKRIINNPTFFEVDIVIAVKKMYSLRSFKIEEEEKKRILELLIIVAEKKAKEMPWRFSLVNAKADLETILSQWDQKWLLKAEESTEMMLSKFPYFPSSHLFAAKLFLLKGEVKKGIQEIQKVIEIDPKIATAYYILGVAYNELNDIGKANENFIKAAKLNYPFADKNQILYVLSLLIPEKEYLIVENLYLRAIQLDSQDDSLYRGLAATYAKLQNKGKAIEYAKKAVELNPAAKEAAEEFIQLVEEEQWDLIGD